MIVIEREEDMTTMELLQESVEKTTIPTLVSPEVLPEDTLNLIITKVTWRNLNLLSLDCQLSFLLEWIFKILRI